MAELRRDLAHRGWPSLSREFLVDQGTSDGFLNDGLRPWLLQQACAEAGIPLTLRMQEGYDHSYFFISTFMADHLKMACPEAACPRHRRMR
jgi:S-formylglutathione hydrolase FrmB